MGYAILKNLTGTYSMTLHCVCLTHSKAIELCNNLNNADKLGIVYGVYNLDDFIQEPA